MLLLLARHVLGGPTDDGRASYQVALDVCEDCQRTRQLADGQLIDVSPSVAAMAHCDAQHVPSAHVGGAARRESPARAAQDVAPRVRRAVLRRDRRRCRVPGCTHARYVDVHHLETKADGGGHEPENLVAVCGAHHRAIHEGTLLITASDGEELAFEHADGTPYGASPSAASSLTQTRAFQALRNLGFGEGEVRRALAGARKDLARDASVEQLLRYGLKQLTERACQCQRAS